MARFMIKASEYKNVCKAVNDRQLESLKKEIIEILKKQDEKEVKKAIDYFNSQELHYTHLEKSLTGKWVEKAGYGIGTVRIWKGKKYKKIAPGKWARVFEKEGRGTNIAIGKLIARVQKIDNVEDLMQFVLENKQRFVDENGKELDILDKVRAAVDTRQETISGRSNDYTYGLDEGVNRAKDKLFERKDKINAKEAELHKVSRKISQIPTSELKQRKAKLERWIENKTRSKRDSLNNAIFRENYQKELDAINAVLDKRNKKKETSFTDKELERLKERGMSVENLRHKGYTDEEIKEFAKPKATKEEIRNQVINGYKNKSEDEIEKDLAYLRKQIKSDDSMTVSLVGSEKMPIKDAIEILKDIKKNKLAEKKEANIETFTADDFRNASREKLYDMIGLKYHQNVKFKNEIWTVDAIAATGHEDGKFQLALLQHYPSGEIKKRKYITALNIDKVRTIEEQEKPETKKKTFKQEMNELYDAQDKAWEGFESGSEIKSTPENSKKFYDRVKKYVEENNIKLTEKHRAEIEDQNGHSFNEALALAGAYGEDAKKKELARNKENSKKYKGIVLDLSQIDEFKEEETKESNSKVVSFDELQPIASNKSVGENEVQIPYSKDLANEMETLKKCVSKEYNRKFMSAVYYKNGDLVATDGKRMKIVKVGKLDGIDDGSFVDIGSSKDGITIKKIENPDPNGGQFPNYSRVIPDNLHQKVTLDSNLIKDKIKEMQKDGAINKKGANLVQLEFRDGKVFIDDIAVGEAKNIQLKTGEGWNNPKEDTNYVHFDADYLTNALSGKTAILQMGEDNRKAMAINTGSTSNIIMPMQGLNAKMDYSDNRSVRAAENEAKDKKKADNRKHSEQLIKDLNEEKIKDSIEKTAKDIDRQCETSDDDFLRSAYEKLNFNFDKILDKKRYITVHDKVNKDGLTFISAYMHSRLAKEHPEVKEKIAAELEKRGISVKKSLFDDFVMDMFIDEDEEIEDAIKTDESLFNDYSAEQPELFNSTVLKVQEAFNRCKCDIL